MIRHQKAENRRCPNKLQSPSNRPKIRKLNRDSSETTYFQLKAVHESDPEFQAGEDLPDGVKKFVGHFHKEVSEQILSGSPSPEVKKVAIDIHDTATPAARTRTVWRGTDKLSRWGEILEIATAEVGDVVKHDLPTSTSTDPATAMRFCKDEILLKITVPKGTQIIVCNSYEMEVLLPQGFGLRIDRIDLEVPVREGGKERHIIKKVIQATVISG